MSIKLFNGDYLVNLHSIPNRSVDLLFTDPPYNMVCLDWDDKLNFVDMWNEYNRILKSDGIVVMFSTGLFTIDLINSNRTMFKYRLIWEKNVPTGMNSAKYRPMKYYEELCVFYYTKGTYNPIMKERVGKHKECYNHVDYEKQPKKYDLNYVQPSDVLHFNVVPNRKGKLHPTQKPLDLCKYIISTYSNEGDMVIDPFMGSGTIPLACKELNRNCIGIEKEKEYFEIARGRINEL